MPVPNRSSPHVPDLDGFYALDFLSLDLRLGNGTERSLVGSSGSKPQVAVVDSGTTHTVLPPRLYAAMERAFEEDYSSAPGIGPSAASSPLLNKQCIQWSTTTPFPYHLYPDLELVLDGFKLRYTPEMYLVPHTFLDVLRSDAGSPAGYMSYRARGRNMLLRAHGWDPRWEQLPPPSSPSSSSSSSPLSSPGGLASPGRGLDPPASNFYCFGIQSSEGSLDIGVVLGLTLLRGYFVSFNQFKKRVGFAAAVPGSCGTDISGTVTPYVKKVDDGNMFMIWMVVAGVGGGVLLVSAVIAVARYRRRVERGRRYLSAAGRMDNHFDQARAKERGGERDMGDFGAGTYAGATENGGANGILPDGGGGGGWGGGRLGETWPHNHRQDHHYHHQHQQQQQQQQQHHDHGASRQQNTQRVVMLDSPVAGGQPTVPAVTTVWSFRDAYRDTGGGGGGGGRRAQSTGAEGVAVTSWGGAGRPQREGRSQSSVSTFPRPQQLDTSRDSREPLLGGERVAFHGPDSPNNAGVKEQVHGGGGTVGAVGGGESGVDGGGEGVG